MALGMEMAAKSLMGMMGLDPEAMKQVFTQRIENFEYNLAVLNANMESINANLKAICEANGIAYTPPQQVLPPQQSEAA